MKGSTISEPDMMNSSIIYSKIQFSFVIHGIPEHEEEDNVANVVTLGKRLQVNLTPGDIDIVHRMNTKNKDKPRQIIARFSNYNAKSKL